MHTRPADSSTETRKGERAWRTALVASSETMTVASWTRWSASSRRSAATTWLRLALTDSETGRNIRDDCGVLAVRGSVLVTGVDAGVLVAHGPYLAQAARLDQRGGVGAHEVEVEPDHQAVPHRLEGNGSLDVAGLPEQADHLAEHPYRGTVRTGVDHALDDTGQEAVPVEPGHGRE